MVDIKRISENIRKCRKIAGLTQAQLAQRMFIAPQTVSKWERGLSIPSVAELSDISDILSVPVSELIYELPSDKTDVMIAVDGGGTKTEFLLFTLDKIISRAVLGASNPNVVGVDTACRIIKKGIQSLVTDNMHLTAIYCGIAGAGNRDNASLIEEGIREKYPLSRILVESDIKNVIGLSDNPDNCIAVIMGTGSSVFYSLNGEIHRVGGWGYIFDSAGSGYDIGREAIRKTLAYEDGIGGMSEVVRMCRERLGDSAYSHIPVLHERGVDYIASFAPIVFDAASRGDSDALEIIRASAERICLLIEHARGKAGFDAHIILAGGLCSGNDIVPNLLRERISCATITVPRYPQVLGALRMCLSLARVDAPEQVFEKIKRELIKESK